MNTSELEQLLEARGESPNLDFKGSCPWDVITYAKDLLAMSNTPSGGRIVVGVDDGTSKRTGILPAIRETYKIDEMRDAMTRFADPHVLFDCESAKDTDGLEYVVITVHPFQEVPIICRIDHQAAGVRAGGIYFRGSHRRAESALVATSYDMRTILLRATASMRATMAEYGFSISEPDKKKLDDELGGL